MLVAVRYSFDQYFPTTQYFQKNNISFYYKLKKFECNRFKFPLITKFRFGLLKIWVKNDTSEENIYPELKNSILMTTFDY